MKIKSKLFVAMMSLVVAVVLATTTTFAWLSMNNKVNVTGINVDLTKQGDLYFGTVANKVVTQTATPYTMAVEKSTNILYPVTLKTVTTPATTPLSFQGVDKADAAGTEYFKLSFTLASVSEYKVKIDLSKLTAILMTTGKPDVGVNKGIDGFYAVTAAAGTTQLVRIEPTIDTTDETHVMVNGVLTAISTGKITFNTIEIAVAYGANHILTVTPQDKVVIKANGDVLNAIRIAVVNKTSINTNEQLKVFNVNSGKGMEAIANFATFNMAQEIYKMINGGTEAGITTEAIKEPEAGSTVEFGLTKGTDTKLLKDTAGNELYTATIDLYIWVEGTDADCLATIANQILQGSIIIDGTYVQKD